jgi:hypothetical protein
MKRVLCIFLAGAALTSIGCDDAAKKAEETAKQAASAAAASASAVAAKASAEVAEKAKAELDGKKGDLKKQITDGLASLDRMATALKEKAAKLPGPVKLKADEAFKKYDTAKAALTGLTGTIDGASGITGLADVGSKITSGLADAKKALEGAEEIITKKK